MTNEEMRRTMEFIVEQQAQFAASIQRAEEERIRDKPRLARLEDSFQRLVALCENMDSRLDTTDTRLDTTDTRLDTTDTRLDTTDTRLDTTDTRLDKLEVNESELEANMSRLAAAQAHADERLSALIDIVREDRNGKSESS
jgi:chromosome segregation ATPase